jgi:uncharacterized membrane protein YidH (DUF202 family)
MTIRYWSGSRSSMLITLNAVLWTVLCFMFMIQLNGYFHPSITFRIAWSIVGISIGVCFTTIITQRQLKTLEKKGEYATTLKTVLITIGIGVVAITAVLELFFSNVPKEIESAFAVSIFGCTPAFWITRAILLFYWERRNKTTIFQDKFGLYVPAKIPVDRTGDQTVSSQAIQIGTSEVKN